MWVINDHRVAKKFIFTHVFDIDPRTLVFATESELIVDLNGNGVSCGGEGS